MILLQNSLYYPDIGLAEATYFIHKLCENLERQRSALEELKNG